MASRTISVVLTAQIDNYRSMMREAQRHTEEVERASRTATQQLEKHNQAMTKVGAGMLAAGATAAAGIALVVKETAEFGAKMAQLQSLSHASSADMQRMADAAMKAGAAYGFSAKQVADAEIELTKAGVGVKEQLGGALQGALTLAAAGQLDVGRATEIATVAMTQFGLKASEVPHLSDLLAAGADKALGSVGDLGEALANGGLQAHNMGLTIEDTVGLLSGFANAGIIGAEAGTQMRSMFIQLQRPTAAATKELQAHGIALNDQKGNFVGITALAGELHDKLLPLPQAQRNAALATIFGSHAITGATVAMNLGAKGMQGWHDKVNESGFAAEQAAGKLDSLSGSWQKLTAAFQTDLIKAGSSGGGQSFLKGIVDGATAALTLLGDMDPILQSAAIDGMTAVAAIALLGGTALIAVPKVVALKVAVDELALSMGTTGGGIAKMVLFSAGFMAAAAAAAYAAQKTAEFNYEVAKSHPGNAPKDVAKQLPAASSRGAMASPNTQGGSAGIGMALGDAFDKEAEKEHAAIRAAKEHAAAQKADSSAATASASATHAVAAAHQTAAQKAGMSEAAYKKAADALHKDAAAANDAANKMRLAGDFAGILKAQLDKLNGVAISDAQAQAAFANALDSFTLKTKNHAAALTGNSRAARENRGAIADLAVQGSSAIESYANQAKSQKDLEKHFRDTRSQMIDQAVAMGANRDEATKLVNAYFKMPKNLETKFDAKTGEALGKTHELSAQAKAYAKKYEAALLADGHLAADAHAKAMAAAAEWDRQHPTATFDAATGTALDKLQRLEAAIKRLNGSTVDVTYNGPTSLSVARKAAGGSIDGPGAKGVDSVPALLAPGEHVLTAGDVDRLGGQAGAYRFREALAAGEVDAYAKGGAVKKKKAKHHTATAHVPRSHTITDYSRIGASHPHATTTVARPPKKKPKRPSGAALAAAAIDWGGRVYAKGSRIVRESDVARQDRLGKTATHEINTDNAAIRRANAAEKAAQRAQDRAQKAYDAIGGGKKDRTAKRAAKAHLDKAKKATKSAEARVTKWEKEKDKDTQAKATAKEAAKALRNDREDFVSAERRNPKRRTEDPLAYVDQLRAMSRDDNFSVGRQKKFDAAANKYEKALVTLTGRSEKAAEKLANLKEASDQLRDSIKGTIAGGFQASAASSETRAGSWITRNGMRFRTDSTGPSAAGLTSYYTKGATAATKFANDLAALAKRGLKAELLAEVAGYGVEQGQPIVTALLAANASQIRSINSGYTSIQSAAGAAGKTVADDQYKGQIAAAKADADQITKQIKEDGEKLRKLIATAFGLKGYATGTDSAAAGIRWVGENGPELLGFGGGEKVLSAPDSARWVRSAGGSPAAGSSPTIQVLMPEGLAIRDSDNVFRGMVRLEARGVASQVVDARHDEIAVRLLGASA